MPDGDLGQRVATLEANKEYTDTQLRALWDYMREGRDFRETVVKQLTKIEGSSERTKDYEERCDKDRQQIVQLVAQQRVAAGRMLAKFGKRLGRVEGFQRNQLKIAGAVSVVIGGLTQGGGKILEKIGAWFAT